jgi:hypothetical protein
MSFSRVALVGIQGLYRRFDWSRHLSPMAQTAADVGGARGGELLTDRPSGGSSSRPDWIFSNDIKYRCAQVQIWSEFS